MKLPCNVMLAPLKFTTTLPFAFNSNTTLPSTSPTTPAGAFGTALKPQLDAHVPLVIFIRYTTLSAKSVNVCVKVLSAFLVIAIAVSLHAFAVPTSSAEPVI